MVSWMGRQDEETWGARMWKKQYSGASSNHSSAISKEKIQRTWRSGHGISTSWKNLQMIINKTIGNSTDDIVKEILNHANPEW